MNKTKKKIIDSSGAGDGYNAAYISEYLISNDVYDFLTVEGSIKNKKTQGSTSFQSVEEQISFAEKILAAHER